MLVRSIFRFVLRYRLLHAFFWTSQLFSMAHVVGEKHGGQLLVNLVHAASLVFLEMAAVYTTIYLLFLRYSSGTYSPAQHVNGPFSFISDFAIYDSNSDGRPDFLVLDERAKTIYLYSNAGGTFPTRSTITSSKFTQDYATVVLSRDFTGDGRPDLLVKDHIDVFLFAGLGNGMFDTARSLIPQAMQAELCHLVAGNFNGDAFMDFAVGTSGFTAFLNDGTGHFIPAPRVSGTVCFLLAPGDLKLMKEF